MYNCVEILTEDDPLLNPYNSEVVPDKFIEISKPSTFPVGSQQDVTEFISHLFSTIRLQDTLSETDIDTTDIITTIFGGQMSSTIISKECHHSSSKDEVFINFIN